MQREVDRLEAHAQDVRSGGFTDVVLLGMGGSSLGPEVIRQVIGVTPGFPRFRALDSIDPDDVRDAMAQAPTSLFIIASKSGSTIEPNVMAAEARRRVESAGHRWGSRCVAITDEGTALHQLARAERFREIFLNPADIGGRYSVLSFFGLVPAALMGVSVSRFLEHAVAMSQECRDADTHANPGVALGALLGAAAEAGRDKLMLTLPGRLASMGLWIEQLIAESTGKSGKGIVPVRDEPGTSAIGSDRVEVTVRLGEANRATARRSNETTVPGASMEMADASTLGAEFFRWEMATATAGWLMGINPFDEPNVQQAKEATRELLVAYSREGQLPARLPHATSDGVHFTLSEAAVRIKSAIEPSALLSMVRAGDYFALLAYLPSSDEAFARTMDRFRTAAAARTGVATTLGYGPRYLHSTGQLHKGGPNTGVFLIVTAEPSEDLLIPAEPYTFGILERAQALGDFDSLDKLGRRALLMELPDRHSRTLDRALSSLLSADGQHASP